ncbi:MAG TPA: hypothetical protein PLL76_23355, partial [Thermoanaerobaculia bacterium]|nr:hypothetical protein [Thermoanaerobaculia bacterium]
AIGGPGGGGGGGGGRTPLVDAANLGASNLVSFAAEVAAATERLRALKPGSGTTGQQTMTITMGSGPQPRQRPTAAEVVPLVRRYYTQLARRVA